MTKGAKFIIIILAVLFLGSLFLAMQINSSKESIIKEYSEKERQLSQKASELASQVSAAQTEKRRIEDRMTSFKKDVDSIAAERDDLKKKYDIVLKERDDLMQKVGQKPSAAAVETKDEGYWAQVLKEKAALELQINDLKSQLSDASIQIEESKKTKAEFELELAKLKQNSEELEKKIQYSTKLANNLSLDLAREKNEKRGIEDRISKLKEENLTLRSQIKELASSKVALEKGLKRLVTDKDNLGRRLEETELIVQGRIDEVLKIKKDLETRLGKSGPASSADESKPIELAPIVVKSGGDTEKPGARVGSLSGKIVSLNEANNFVIIDLGQDNGVKVGDDFKVYRQDKQIASIEVIQTRKDISAADIRQKNQKIQVGDLVK